MNLSLRYLEQSEIERRRLDLESQGYDVEANPGGMHQGLDLIARKPGHVLGLLVRAPGNITAEVHERMKRGSVGEGLDELRLVVVPPPIERKVEIEGIEDALYQFIINDLPETLDGLSTHTGVEDVSTVEIQSVEMHKGRTHVAGQGIVEVRLSYGSSSDTKRGDGVNWSASFPFRFDVVLDEQLQVMPDASSVEVDTSEFYE